MAQRKPIVIDGLVKEVPPTAKTLADIETENPPNFALIPGKGLIPKAQFDRTPIPEGYERVVSDTIKAARRTPTALDSAVPSEVKPATRPVTRG